MRSINTYYQDRDSLIGFIEKNHIHNTPSLLIQIFSAIVDETFISTLLSELNHLLPDAVIIGTTTDGEIKDGIVSSGKVVLSFSLFENTTLKKAVVSYDRYDNFESGRYLGQKLINDDTKLLISFADGLHTNGEEFLNGIASVNHGVPVAGGLAGDNFAFKKTLVFTDNHILDNGAVAVALESTQLYIHTDYSFNWQPIGNEMIVTKIEGNRLYTLDGKTAIDIYSHYLGIRPEQFMQGTGIEFPLIVSRNGLNIARAIISKEDDGSVIMAGNLSKGDKVRIGFGDAKGIISQSQQIIETAASKPSEAIFVYSCTARRYFMGKYIQSEVLPLQSIAPVSGFFTYGEFYTSSKKELLNQTMTIVSISETPRVKKMDIPLVEVDISRSDYFSALIHLINVTSQEVRQYTDALQETNLLYEMLKERLELALTGSNDGVWDWNLIDNSVYFSPRWKEMLGFEDDELPSVFASWEERVHPDDLEAAWRDINRNFHKETEYYENIHRLRHKKGHWIWILDRGKTLFDDKGRPVRMIGTHTDITEQKMLQLKNEEQHLIIEQINDGVIRTDMKGNIVSWNCGAEKMYGYKASEILGNHISVLFHPDDFDSFSAYAKILIERGQYSADKRFISKENEEIFVSFSLSLLKDEDGKEIGLIGVNQDITERKKVEKQLAKQKDKLYYQAHYDALTGLPNRVLFMDRLEQAIIKAKRNGKKVALFFIDVDKFKYINDSYGHQVGDEVLKIVAERLGSAIREGDTLARLSGDEFTMIFEELNDSRYLASMAHKLLEIIKQPMLVDDHEIYLSLSIGIALYPDDTKSASDLLKYADTAMYKAKESGRNDFQFYASEMTEYAVQRMTMKTSIKQAIEKDEFVVYFQPQLDVTSGKVIGLEALVRWKSPEKGCLLPGAFIPLAEETGMVVEIDRLVIEKAINQVTQWVQEGIFSGILAINLTVKHLENKEFVDDLKSVVEQYDMRPENLELEISEVYMMKSFDQTADKIEEITALGMKMSIDDFGTGYSSFSLLKRLNIHQLKIDQTFVADIPNSKESLGIVKAVIALAKGLNMDIIAEGVEKRSQEEFLLEQGCNKMQGNYFCKPLSADEMEEFLKNSKQL